MPNIMMAATGSFVTLLAVSSTRAALPTTAPAGTTGGSRSGGGDTKLRERR